MNLTKTIDDWYTTSILEKEQLFFWNYVQGFLAQPECAVSYISGTQTLIPECWDYAWIFRPMLLVAVSDVLIGIVVVAVIVFIIVKSVMQSSGSYANMQKKIEDDNLTSGTTWTFP
mgnify:CR=1 FL=1